MVSPRLERNYVFTYGWVWSWVQPFSCGHVRNTAKLTNVNRYTILKAIGRGSTRLCPLCLDQQLHQAIQGAM